MVNLSAFGEAKPPARQQLWHVSTGFFETSKILSTVDAKQLQTIVEQNLTSRGSALLSSLVW
jgi:hypothetical protein